MITKDEFLQAALDAADAFPNVQQFVRARDPRVLAQLEAQAAMLAMLSAQVDVAKFEPFIKARDATILADAALKGILPLGRACKLTLTIQNAGTVLLTFAAQRRLFDSKGRVYELDATVTIQPGESEDVTATQIRRRSSTSTVTAPSDFYALSVGLSSDELFLNTLVVSKGAQEFNYKPDWFNVAPGEFAYQVEVDELRRMAVKFGKASVVGYGVQQGDVFTLDITECNGRINDLAPGSQFTLEYILAAGETSLKALLSSVQDEGAAPHTMPELRVMARYPAIYDHNAVYLGEFAFLLRRYITGIRFLSAWNEQIEEAVRGASTNNINTLFVSGLVSGMLNATFEARVRSLLARADDSYRICFVPAVLVPVAVTITGAIAISWDRATVESQIRALILSEYGDGSINVSEGRAQPIKRAQINRLLNDNIEALRDEKAEFSVSVTLPTTPLPEHFLYVSAASLTVSMTSTGYGQSLWNF